MVNPVIDQERADIVKVKTKDASSQLLPQWVRPEKELPVVNLDITWVRFSTRNHRTRAEQNREEHKSGNSKLFTGDPLGDNAQDIQLNILSKQDGFEDLKIDLKERGQKEPAVVTTDGVLINGNRRAAALRQLWLDNRVDKFRSIRAIVLPEDAMPAEMVDLETELQVSKDYWEEYSWVNEALLIEEIFESSDKKWDVVAKRMRLKKEDVQEQYEKLQLLHELVALSKGQKYLADFVDNNSAFRELAIYIRGKSTQDAAPARTVYFLGTLAGTNYRDLRHLRRDDAVEFVRDEFSKDDLLKSYLSNTSDGAGSESTDLLDDVLGENSKSDVLGIDQVLAILATQEPKEIVNLPTGESVAVEQLFKSVQKTITSAATEASEDKKDARAVVAPIEKLKLATANIIRATKALKKARSQSEWNESVFLKEVEKVKEAISQIEKK